VKPFIENKTKSYALLRRKRERIPFLGLGFLNQGWRLSLLLVNVKHGGG